MGNGGLSLRRVRSALDLVRDKESIPGWNFQKKEFLAHEDRFFAYCGHNEDVNFNVPNPWIATQFAVQNDSFHGLRVISKRGLPFGVHMFPARDYSFWKPVIESCGYELPDIESVVTRDVLEEERWDRYCSYFIHYLSKTDDKFKEKIRKDLNLDCNYGYILWGYGKYGKRLLRALNKLDVRVEGIIDRKQKKCNYKISDSLAV